MSFSSHLLASIVKRVHLLILLLVLIAVYAAAGYYWLPLMVQTRWLPELARQHNLSIELQKMTFDPFGMGVNLTGVSLRDASGQPFLSAAEISVDIAVQRSMEDRIPRLSVMVNKPSIQLVRDRNGQLNLAGLLPDKSGDNSTDLPVTLDHLSLAQGSLSFTDTMAGKPVSTRFEDINLDLRNLSGNPDTPANLRLSLTGTGEESMTLEAMLSLRPMKLDGWLEAKQLYLPFWLDTLKPDLPWRLATGQLSSRLRMQYPADEFPSVALQTDQLVLTGLNVMNRQNHGQWLRFARMELNQVQLGGETPLLSVENLLIAQIESPWGKLGGLKMDKVATDPRTGDVRLNAMQLSSLEGKAGKIKAADTGPLTWDAHARQLQLASARVPLIESQWGSLSGLAVEGLSSRLSETGLLQEARVQSLSAGQAITPTGKVSQLVTGPLVFNGEKRQLHVGRMVTPDIESRWGSLRELALSDITGSFSESFALQELQLNSATLSNANLKDAEGKGITTGPLSYAVGPGRVRLSSLTAAAIKSQLANGTGLELEALEYGLNDQQLTLGQLNAASVTSHWGNLTSLSIGNLLHMPGERRLRLDHLAAQQIDSAWGNITGPTLQNAEYDIRQQHLQVASVVLGATTTLWGQASSLAVNGLNADMAEQSAYLADFTATGLAAKAGQIGSANGVDVRFNGQDKQLTLARGALADIRTTEINAGRIDLDTLAYDTRNQSFKVKSATLTDAIAQGLLGNEVVNVPANSNQPGLAAETGSGPADPSREPRRARIGSIHLEEARGGLNQHFFAAHLMTSGKTELDIIRHKNHDLEIRGLNPFSQSPETGSTPAAPTLGLGIDEFQLSDSSINFFDETTDPPVHLRFTGLTLKTFDVTSDRTNDMEFKLRTQLGSSSRIEAEGRANLNPLRVTFRFGIDKLRLRSVEPYFKSLTNLEIQRGSLNMWGDIIALKEPGLRIDYSGAADIVDFEAVDREHKQPVMGWNSLKFDGLAVSNQPKRFVSRILIADKPYVRVAMDEDHKLNLHTLLSPPSEAAIPSELKAIKVEKTPRNQLPTASIGLLRVNDGKVDFSDRSIKPGFTTEFRKFEGSVSGLSSRVGAIARLLLEGRINGNSPVKVFGELDPLNFRKYTDVSFLFKGLNLTTFSSYSGKFAGYRIEKGKLDMDVRYKMKDTLLEVENRAVLDRLTLGEKVDDSSSWLVDLAVFILKKGDGKIDIDLPVYGDLRNPQFSLWSLYRTAFVSLMSKLYYSPYTLVNEVVYAGEPVEYFVAFTPGQSEISEAAASILFKAFAAMESRPEANLDIQGTADPEDDRIALAQQALQDKLKVDYRADLRARGIRLRGGPVPDMSEEDYRRMFTAFYREKHPLAPEINAIKSHNQAVLTGKGFEVAHTKVLQEWPIDETALRALAQARGESIRSFLIDKAGGSDERIFLRDVKLGDYPASNISTLMLLEGS